MAINGERGAMLIAPFSDSFEHYIIPGVPVAKTRPRVTRTGHTYTPSSEFEHWVQSALANARKLHGIQTLTTYSAFIAQFFMPTVGLADGDNLIKLYMDASEKAGIVSNDKLFKIGLWLVDYDALNPRTVITVGELTWPNQNLAPRPKAEVSRPSRSASRQKSSRGSTKAPKPSSASAG